MIKHSLFKHGETELVMNFQWSSQQRQIPCLDAGTTQHDSSPCSRFSACGSRHKHLGSVVDDDHHCNADTLARVHSAMSAYSPIAITVFGDTKFSVQLRLLLARSLVFSRLFHGTQAWSAVSLWSLKKLNTVYMRFQDRLEQSSGLTVLAV